MIIADTKRDKSIYGQLTSIAPTISLTNLGAGYGDTLTDDLVIGEAVNKCKQMEDVISAHLKRMSDLAAAAPKVHLSVLYADTEPPDFATHGANQWELEILATIGLKSVVPAKPGSRSQKISLEQLFSYNPEVMFLGASGEPSIVDTQWKSSPVWKQLSAVQNNRVFTVDDGLWSVERGIKTSEKVLQQAVDSLKGSGN
ncbi:MAG TPA: ABC transporter substrate-binding protein [Mycobacterium sp.]|nr:ABC transporter substrate-binding protein [Mycobacterium sp.]